MFLEIGHEYHATEMPNTGQDHTYKGFTSTKYFNLILRYNAHIPLEPEEYNRKPIPKNGAKMPFITCTYFDIMFFLCFIQRGVGG